MEKQNLFANLPELADGESFQEVIRQGNVVIERIVSSDRPEETTYDQPQDEWVLLLQGRATLEVAGKAVDLAAGDYLLIPAHTVHRVLSTSTEPKCVWLAVHLHPPH